MFGQLSFLISLLFMSLALSMDAFSVSLSMGLQNIRLKYVAFIGFVIGFFHMILPFIGMVMGQFISSKVAFLTTVVGGFLLIFIGLLMFFSAFGKQGALPVKLSIFNIFMIAFVVSIDSFPVGIGLGISGMHIFFVIFLFGIMSMILSWIGMMIGKKTHHHLGKYSEMIGGFILFVFGLLVIFQ